jgi:hypothetical protein
MESPVCAADTPNLGADRDDRDRDRPVSGRHTPKIEIDLPKNTSRLPDYGIDADFLERHSDTTERGFPFFGGQRIAAASGSHCLEPGPTTTNSTRHSVALFVPYCSSVFVAKSYNVTRLSR